jgi:hypothetical protein
METENERFEEYTDVPEEDPEYTDAPEEDSEPIEWIDESGLEDPEPDLEKDPEDQDPLEKIEQIGREMEGLKTGILIETMRLMDSKGPEHSAEAAIELYRANRLTKEGLRLALSPIAANSGCLTRGKLHEMFKYSDLPFSDEEIDSLGKKPGS